MISDVSKPKAALTGVRVLDFTNLLAGPFPSLLLGFLGAEVIKVESNTRLDAARRPPYSLGDPDKSPVFNSVNLNKLSVQLNLKEPQAISLVHRLAAISDVVVENMRPGVMDRLGLGYSRLREINPTMIMAAISGAGSTGPESSYPGYAPAFSALGGLGHLTGYGDGPPAEMHDSIDCRIGSTALFALLTALFRRRRTGQGEFIDLSSREAIAMFSGEALMDYAMNGVVQERRGNREPGLSPHGCYRCLGDDRWLTLAVGNQEEWIALCQVTGNPQWADDPRFADALKRWDNQEELDQLIQTWTSTRDAGETAEMLQNAGIAAEVSLNGKELADDPHLHARKAWDFVDHPTLGHIQVPSPPWKFSETPATIRTPGPLLGQHNDYVLGELLGVEREDIGQWAENGVID
jgi:benzylsuccinate CoA-transferase BbsF subunit